MPLKKHLTCDLITELKARKCFISESYIMPDEEYSLQVRPDKEYIEKFQINKPDPISREWKESIKGNGIAYIMVIVD